MRVLMNAASANMGGALTYLKNVLGWAARLAADDQFLVVVPQHTREKIGAAAKAENITVRTYPYARTGGIARLYFDQVAVPRLAAAENADVLFSSTGFGTFYSPCPEVLLVRNPVYFDPAFQAKYRELGRSLLRTTVRRWHSLLSMRCADAVLFPTQAMQDMVGRYIALDAKPTRALHYGFDAERFFQNGAANSEWRQRIENWTREGHHVLLNVSTYAVHKNFETLIEALAQLRRRGHAIKLLTTTSEEQTSDTEEYAALQQRARTLGVSDCWHELGYVPYPELHSIYQAADLYVFPSFTESFGHSLVEAMAAGLPVVAADMPVNREVCEPVGRFFSTFDAEDCAQTIEHLLRDDNRRAHLAEASTDRAKHFSWERYTSDLVALLRQTAQRR